MGHVILIRAMVEHVVHLRRDLLSTIVMSHFLTVLYSTVLIEDEESTIRAFIGLLRYSTTPGLH